MRQFTERDIDSLSRTLYGEAESGNLSDAVAIASVNLNRVSDCNWNRVWQVGA